MIKFALISSTILCALTPLMAQDLIPNITNDPVIVDEMELSKTEVLENKIKKVTLKINNPVEKTTLLKWVSFNADATVSEYLDYNDHRKYSYDYDAYGRLKSLKTIDLIEMYDVDDTVVSIFRYAGNRITETRINQNFSYEWIYKYSAYTVLLEKNNYRIGMKYSTKQYKYENNKLIEITFERDGRPYNQENYYYNRRGLIERTTYLCPWNGYRDSTLYYYGGDMVLDFTRQGHYRSGGDEGLYADWQNLTLFHANGKWYKRYTFSRNRKMYRWVERFYNENDLLIREEHHDLEDEGQNTVTTYMYEYYDE
ncbi:MAG: hypothetical protein QNK23_10725 [Crocinitomicaceae bacterium]|nr:hypothetical protein [Crocinitomicaceae bacterium]